MDPITIVLRSSKTPAASAPVGGEMSAEEIDDNFSNLKTAAEQLEAEKLAIASAVDLAWPADAKESPVDADYWPVWDTESASWKLVSKAAMLAGVVGAPSGSSEITRDEYEALAAEVQEARGNRSRLSLRIGTVSNFASPNAGGVVIGQYFDNSFQGTVSSSLAGAVNRFDLAPYYTSVPLRIDRIGCVVSTAVAASLFKVVIYSSNEDGWPDELLLETGDLSGAAAGFVESIVDFSFDSGRQYWVGVRHSSTCSLRSINVSSAVNLGLTASTSTQYATVLRRTLAYGTATPSSYNFVNADRTNNIAPPSVRMRAAANVPSAMRYAQWGAVPGTDEITIDIGELPANGGSAITALEYRIDGSAATALAGLEIGSRTVPATSGVRVVEVRAVNAVGAAPWSDAKTRTVVAGVSTAPAAFTVGQWTSTPGDGQIVVEITGLPSDGGSPITALQYTLNGSTWTAFAGTGTGLRTIAGVTNDTAYPVQIRAVNAIGNGAASDTKSTTPTAAAPASLEWIGTPTIFMQYVGAASHDVSVHAGAALGDMLLLPVYHWTGEPPTSIVASNGQTLSLLAQYSSASELGGIYGVVIAGTVPTSVTITPTGAPNGAWAELHVARGVSAVAGTVLDGNAFAPRTSLSYNTDSSDALVLAFYSTPGDAAGRVLATFAPTGGSGTISPIFDGIPTGIARGVHSGATGANNAAITWSAADTSGGRWLSLALKA